MEFEILGPLRVRADDGQLIALHGTKPRALLAMLLLAPNQAIRGKRAMTLTPLAIVFRQTW